MPKVPQPWLVQYLDGSGFIDPAQPLDPGFTKILQDTVGDVGGPSDGFDQIVSEAFGLIDALDAASAEQDAVLDALLTQQAPLDTGPLDTSMQGYVDTIGYGDSIVTASNALALPQLGELPMSTSFGYGDINPPTQLTHDFGSVPLGSASIQYFFGREFDEPSGISGTFVVNIISGDPAIFSTFDDSHLHANTGFGYIDHYLMVTPAKAGTFKAQVNVVGGFQVGLQLWTMTVTVTP